MFLYITKLRRTAHFYAFYYNLAERRSQVIDLDESFFCKHKPCLSAIFSDYMTNNASFFADSGMIGELCHFLKNWIRGSQNRKSVIWLLQQPGSETRFCP